MDKSRYHFVIVDDNPNVPTTLSYLFNLHHLNAEWSYFNNPIQAVEYFRNHTCDLLFLDVEMPEMSGFELLEKITTPPFTVILTTYSEKYAEKAFLYLERNLLDFISKDLLIPQFRRIKERFINRHRDDFFLVNRNSISDELIKVPISEIKYFLREKDYVYVVVGSEPMREYYMKIPFSILPTLLPPDSFFDARRGIIIMMAHVENYRLGTVSLGLDNNGNMIIIKISYRQHGKFIKQLRSRHSLITLEDKNNPFK
ncbi:MAG: LytTR family DNA-binding domain-containing protein [Bacteroidales bacterium]|jgi:two-component system LytT family response regulator|nr:LytTR family DNA-binding domain-containing protein [Bacteroidales bacterium]